MNGVQSQREVAAMIVQYPEILCFREPGHGGRCDS